MDELNLNRAFVQVVESGSFSAAARHLNTSVTSVARQVNSLETALGVRLLNRTTRRQSLTEAGQLYYARVTELLRQMDNIKRDVSSFQEAVKGTLRVHLRTSVGNEVIVPALPDFLARHSDVSLDVTLTDDRADLVALGIDVAVWLGHLQDSSMIARRLSPGRRVMCASPDYLRRCGQPKTPQELPEHNCLVYSAKNYDALWRLSKGDKTIAVNVAGNLRTNSSSVLLTSAINGLGLVIVQEAMAKAAIDKGELCRVLDDYQVSATEIDTAIYAVYPHGRRVSPKTRAFVDFLVELFQHGK